MSREDALKTLEEDLGKPLSELKLSKLPSIEGAVEDPEKMRILQAHMQAARPSRYPLWPYWLF